MQIKLVFSKLNPVVFTGCLAALGLTANVAEANQTLYPIGSQGEFKGPEAYFTGDMQVDLLFPENETAHYSGAYVTFQPGARTAWHQHPAGQHMIVTEGTALTGTRDGKIIEFRKGETVWCPKDVDHWHGATEEASMTHLVITGNLQGENVVWKEKVSDAQYHGNRQQVEKKATSLGALAPKQQGIVPIAAFTASGDLDSLKTAISEGLDKGLSINEIKEIQMHLYAYAGFPRTLNGLATLMGVIEARKAKGIEDALGETVSPLPDDYDNLIVGKKIQTQLAGKPVTGPLFDFAPYSNELLQRHLFGDLFSRDVLDFQSREIATVAALSNMSGVEPQLKAHIGIAMNAGIKAEQLNALAHVLESKVSRQAALRNQQALQVLDAKTGKSSKTDK